MADLLRFQSRAPPCTREATSSPEINIFRALERLAPILPPVFLEHPIRRLGGPRESRASSRPRSDAGNREKRARNFQRNQTIASVSVGRRYEVMARHWKFHFYEIRRVKNRPAGSKGSAAFSCASFLLLSPTIFPFLPCSPRAFPPRTTSEREGAEGEEKRIEFPASAFLFVAVIKESCYLREPLPPVTAMRMNRAGCAPNRRGGWRTD